MFVDGRRSWVISVDLHKMSTDAQTCLQSGTTSVSCFSMFTALYRCLMLFHTYQTMDFEEIYRLVSKILNSMHCGSVFGRFCVLCKN